MTENLRHSKAPIRQLSTYWDRSQWPLQSLLFLLPLLLVYEIGSVWTAPSGAERLPKILAESLLGKFFLWFGVTGYYLPSAIVVVVLLCMHVARRDHWVIEPKLYLIMMVESMLLAIPLFVFMLVLFRDPSLQNVIAQATTTTGDVPGVWYTGLIHSIGAGVYEELMFRLIAIALLHLVLVDVLALPEHLGASVAVMVSALAFAMYHFESVKAIEIGRFLFYTLAGIYFAAVYVMRGFGIAAVTHAMYDVYVNVLIQSQPN